MASLKLFDSTLRDGSHAIRHQLSKEDIEKTINWIDRSASPNALGQAGN